MKINRDWLSICTDNYKELMKSPLDTLSNERIYAALSGKVIELEEEDFDFVIKLTEKYDRENEGNRFRDWKEEFLKGQPSKWEEKVDLINYLYKVKAKLMPYIGNEYSQCLKTIKQFQEAVFMRRSALEEISESLESFLSTEEHKDLIQSL